jgi:hypothetical protein
MNHHRKTQHVARNISDLAGQAGGQHRLATILPQHSVVKQRTNCDNGRCDFRGRSAKIRSLPDESLAEPAIGTLDKYNLDMLIPRFSVRWMLLATTVCAFVFLVARFAVRGDAWAVAIVVAVAALATLFLMFAALFASAMILGRLVRWRQPVLLESPFATDKLPPQIIPPREPN